MSDRGAPPDERRALRAGRLEASWWPDGSVRDLRFAGVQLFDAIYAAVRDVAWGTASSVVESHRIDATDDAFVVRAVVRQCNDEVDVRWGVELTGHPGGARIEIEGESLRRQRVNRAGLALLHPLSHRGATLRGRTADREVVGELGRAVAPAPLLTGLRSMSVSLLGGGTLDLELSGDDFETEDHRNWMDAGWKTYCTPLDRPHPRTLEQGDRIRQAVEIGVVGPFGPPPELVDVVEIGGVVGVVPDIGAFPGSGLEVGAARHRARTWPPDLLPRTPSPLHPPLRLTVATDVAGVRAAARRVAGLREEVTSVCVLDADGRVTTDEVLDAWREADVAGPAVVTGTDRHLAELNRATPAVGAGSAVQLGVDPQVHHTDTDLVVAGARALPEMVAHARTIGGGGGVHLSPLRLPSRLARDGSADASAAWAAAVVPGLAAADVVSVAPPAVGTADGAVEVLAALAGWHGRSVRALALPAGLTGMAVDLEDHRRILLASAVPWPLEVPTSWSRTVQHLGPYGWTWCRVG